MKRLPLFGSIDQIKEFLNTNKNSGLKIEIISTRDKYQCVSEMLWNIRFRRLSKTDRHIVFKLLNFFTGYSLSHAKRLAAKWRGGTLAFNPSRRRHKFSRKYYPADINLLITTDVAHSCLSGEATRVILRREFKIFKRADYANISHISASHIYNIRNKNRQYNSSQAKFFKRTEYRNIDIGVRRKPQPNGQPGYVRVDTVHQGDYLGNKGVYHINIVDEVTQYELIATVEQITERYLKPVVEALLKLFPFAISEFHADNGSEYINRWVVELLNKIHVDLTKSRSRHSNDNALVESKNGSVIRKMYGRNYIDRKWADEINEFDKNYLNIYLNYHRPCAFAVCEPDKNGKMKKKYKQRMAPYEKLKSLDHAEQYLKSDFSFAELDKIAYAMSDNQFAEKMQKEKTRLFKKISGDNFYKNQKQTENKNPLDWLNQKG
ncbi:MAG: integrase [bacterium]|nr:integrase [bacterium]